MPPENHPLVFVYGTLKRGFHNHRVMEEAGAQFVCAGATVTCFPLVQSGLPFLLHRPGEGHRVEGEIFRVPTAAGWERLDRLEGHPTFYRRKITPIQGDEGDLYAAWTYFLARADKDLARLPPLCAYGRDSGAAVG